MQIRGKTVVVTGGAEGIGRACALSLAAKGAGRIVLFDLDEAGMSETVRQARGVCEVLARRVDVGDLEALKAALLEVGGYDILHNNAGVVSGAAGFPEAGIGTVRQVLGVNLAAAIVATEAALPVMRARGGGVIVNTVSTVALADGFADALYAASKAGLLMFTRCCAALKEEMNVRVAGVLPGLTDTPILQKTGSGGRPAPWMGPILSGTACAPLDIAEAVVDLIEDDALVGGDWVAVRRTPAGVTRQWGHDG